MKATAIAPANIAFIKYWGKIDEALRLPLNPSISMNLSNTYTRTTVEFDKNLLHDEVVLHEGNFSEDEIKRVVKCLTFIRDRAGVSTFANVSTQNTFPKGIGAAASASGFAALTVAAFASLGMRLSERELTVFARLGSGSACRSIPDGFVQWITGDTSESSYAYSLHPHDWWDLRDILVVVDSSMKKVSTTEGMGNVRTSPNLTARLAALPDRTAQVKQALQSKNLVKLGEVIEEECLDMHHVMQTQHPPLYYWNDDTKRIMDRVKKREVPAYFTIDAGPNVHVICEAKDEARVVRMFSGYKLIINRPSKGAHLV